MLPGVSLASPEDAFALESNPSALAFLSSWEVAYSHTDVAGNETLIERGDLLYGATPLPLRFAIAGGIDWIRPSGALGIPRRGRFSLGLAWAKNRQWSVGGALRYLASNDRAVGGITSVDLSVSWRPSSTLSFGLVAHDLLGPFGLTTSDADVPATFALGAQLRPFATNAFWLESIFALDTEGQIGVRGIASVHLPRVGRLWGSVEGDRLRADQHEWRALIGADVQWGPVVVGGASILGDELRRGWNLHARLSGHHRPGIPTRGFIDDIEVGGLGARGILRLLVRLDRDRRDSRIRGVLLRLRGSGLGL